MSDKRITRLRDQRPTENCHQSPTRTSTESSITMKTPEQIARETVNRITAFDAGRILTGRDAELIAEKAIEADRAQREGGSKMTTDFSNPFDVEATEGGVFVNELGEKMVEMPNRGQGFQWLLLNKQGNTQLLHKGEWWEVDLDKD